MKKILKGIFVGGIEDCQTLIPTIHLDQDCLTKTNNETNLSFEIKDDENDAEKIIDILDKSEKFIDFYRDNGGVLIHCTAGLSRSATLIFLYLVRKGEIKNYSEFKKLYPQWFPNLGFEKIFSKLGLK